MCHHPPHPDNVTVPHGRPNLRSRLHFSHNREGDHEVHKGHVVALGEKKKFEVVIGSPYNNFVTVLHADLLSQFRSSLVSVNFYRCQIGLSCLVIWTLTFWLSVITIPQPPPKLFTQQYKSVYSIQT
jgi:hypothetical protein